MNFNTVLAILGIILLLAVGGVAGWFLRPVPEEISTPATVEVKPDSSSLVIARGEIRRISTERDSIARMLFKSRLGVLGWKHTAVELADSIKAILASKGVDSVEVITRSDTSIITAKATAPLSEDTDTTFSVRLRVLSDWTYLFPPINLWSLETAVDSFDIPIMMVQYRTTEYLQSDTYRLWGTYGLSYHRQTVGFPLGLGIGKWYYKFTPYIKQEPAHEIGRTWRLF